jgi:hypothetical protein
MPRNRSCYLLGVRQDIHGTAERYWNGKVLLINLPKSGKARNKKAADYPAGQQKHSDWQLNGIQGLTENGS